MESLDKQTERVRMAWRSAFPYDDGIESVESWVVEVFEEHVIAQWGQDFYQVSYSEVGDEVAFASRANWQEVEHIEEWVAKSARQQIAETGKNTLKTISANDDDLRVANYIILFGDNDTRDLEFLRSGPNPDGSMGEFFTEKTVVESAYTKTGVLHLDWEHGQGPRQDGLGPDKDEVLGVVDWKTATVDKMGIWVDRVLDRSNQYVQMLEDLLNAGLISTSSEAISKHVKVKETGEIERWPLYRDTLTVNPAEPRMLTANVLKAYKSLGIEPKVRKPEDAKPAPVIEQKAISRGETKNRSKTMYETMQEALSAYAEANGLEVDALNAKQKAYALRGTEWESQGETITRAEADAIAEKAAEKAVKAFQKAAPAINGGAGASELEVIVDEADKPFESDGEFFMAVKTAALVPHKMDPRLKSRKAGTGLNESEPEAGGFLVQQTTSDGIAQRMYNLGQILSRVSKDSIGANSNGMTYNRVDETSRATGSRQGGLQGYWIAEGATMTASRPAFDQVELKLKKIAALAYATEEQIQDAAALESWLNREVPNELTFMVEDAIYNGDGVGKPLGLMKSNALVTVTREDANQIDIADISTMWARRWAGLGSQYVWLIEQSATAQLMQMSLSNQPVYLPPGGLADRPYGSLLGRPVIEVEYAAALGTTGDIMLVDLSQYQAIDKGGVQSASSMHVQFVTDEMAYRFIYRIDGAPFWKSALTPFTDSNTRSPYVVLSTSS